jgi:hypothetical protein
MSPLQQASILTLLALGLGFVLVGTMVGVPTASNALPSASSSLR